MFGRLSPGCRLFLRFCGQAERVGRRHDLVEGHDTALSLRYNLLRDDQHIPELRLESSGQQEIGKSITGLDQWEPADGQERDHLDLHDVLDGSRGIERRSQAP